MQSFCLSAAAVLLLGSSSFSQAPVDLNSWTAESYPSVASFNNGNWAVNASGTIVTQTVNGQPTLFYSSLNAFNLQYQGTLRVSGSDDDYVGFVLGFQPGDSSNPNADYLLIDWKRSSQSFNFGAPSCTPQSTALGGLAVSRVRGVPTADELWGHLNLDTPPCSGPSDSVTELARATNLGSTGWSFSQPYVFRFEYSATSLRVFVDGSLELDISGIFPNGRFGFYNFSQAGTEYSLFSVNCLASWSNYGMGVAGTLGAPQLSLASNPTLGSTTSVDFQSANPQPAVAFAAIGLLPANVPLAQGGNLLVAPQYLFELPGLLPPGVTSFPFVVSNSTAFCGFAYYLQGAHVDPAAPMGFAFTSGLEAVFGL